MVETQQLVSIISARYMSSAQGSFRNPDPVLLSHQGLLDPQQWNVFSYVRNNPLKLLDPDGRKIKVLDDLASKRIQSTVPEELRSSIKVDKNGLIDKNCAKQGQDN